MDSLSTADGLDTLNIAALIYRLDAGVPLLVDANETAKRLLPVGDRFPTADPWQWLDARQYPASGREHPALLEGESQASHQWQYFHIRQNRQPLQSIKLKVSPLDAPAEGAQERHVLIAIGEIATADIAPSLLPQAQPHLYQTLGNLPMGVCVIDTEGYLRLVNRAFCRFFGYAERDLLNAHFRKLLPQQHRLAADKHHAANFPEALNQRRAVEVLLRDGSTRTVIIEDTISQDDLGRPQHIAFLVDITERRNLERRLEQKNRRLEYLATRDDLTGLHNRRFGLELLEQALERSQRYGEKVSVAMLDLDYFKEINDQYGHPVGDTILIEFGRLVRESLRSSDTFIRWGGEEFMMILPGIDRFSAQTTLNRLIERLRHHPMSTYDLHVSFSAGVGEHHHQTSKGLLEEIDQALYQAKSAGRSCVAIAPISISRPGQCCNQAFSSL
ncbi:GGDEF domain-containing protein [Salinicola halimionae]|uniref:GGDEF domain-containing protein n=1 Tax=Salinicola halimionae TaxID=1949081 RepID=UPI00165EC356|nr:sensor domain-containing diguanylate cyclase [Salinicola halimionae]